jgi:hypothetical protein
MRCLSISCDPKSPTSRFLYCFLLQLCSCEDLFDEDTDGMSYDTSKPAGTDEYPYINIYGSCKTCEAYVLDYFAEEAFESVEEHKQLAIVYMAGAIAGFIFTFISFIKYKVSPTAENEIELLGSDGGVMA